MATFALVKVPAARPDQLTSVTTYSAEADARVEEAAPDGNFGLSSYVRADGGGDPEVDSYLRFSVTGLSGLVTSAKVRLYATSPSVDGPSLYAAGDDWSERAVTWQNRPSRLGGVLADAGVVVPGQWVEYDVTPVVTGVGTYSFELATASSDGANFSSRDGAFAPELVIETTPADTIPPTQPADVGVSGATEDSITLQWSASTDNVGVAGYELSRDGAEVDTTPETNYTFGGLACGTAYTLGVDAFDEAGNTSAQTQVTASTTPCGGGYVKTLDSTNARPVGLSEESNNCTLGRFGLGDTFTMLPTSTRCTWTNSEFSHMHRHEVFEVSMRFDSRPLEAIDWENEINLRPSGAFGNHDCADGGNHEVMLLRLWVDRHSSPDEWHLDIRGGESLNLSDQVVTSLDLGPVGVGQTLRLKLDIVSDYQHGAASVWKNGALVYSNRDRPLGFQYDCDRTTDLSNFDLRMQHGVYRGWTSAPLTFTSSGFRFLVSEPAS